PDAVSWSSLFLSSVSQHALLAFFIETVCLGVLAGTRNSEMPYIIILWEFGVPGSLDAWANEAMRRRAMPFRRKTFVIREAVLHEDCASKDVWLSERFDRCGCLSF
ncbi:MAG: hypothetical protein ACQEVT_03835, partial [Pseudomonadota bacterium]